MNQTSFDEIQPAIEPAELLMMFLAIIGGAFAAAVILPTWLPGLTDTLLGDQPKAYWYLARASGFIAFIAMWLSVAFGLIITNKMARLWNGGPLAVDLHQFTTWLSIALTLFHALILTGDRYIQSTPLQVLTPFGYIKYEPQWVGIGQIAFYLAIVVAVSFYFRKRLGFKTWRRLHYLSFLVYVLITLHGVFAGTDSASLMMVYLAFGVGVYFLTIYRILQTIRVPASATAAHHAPPRPAAAVAKPAVAPVRPAAPTQPPAAE